MVNFETVGGETGLSFASVKDGGGDTGGSLSLLPRPRSSAWMEDWLTEAGILRGSGRGGDSTRTSTTTEEDEAMPSLVDCSPSSGTEASVSSFGGWEGWISVVSLVFFGEVASTFSSGDSDTCSVSTCLLFCVTILSGVSFGINGTCNLVVRLVAS